jgi:hypothetical protein
MMRTATMADMTATATRVEVFEIVKQKSISAMKKVTILNAGGRGFINMSRG